MINENYTLLDIVRTLFRWKRPILTTCAIAGIGSILICLLFLDDYFMSKTVIYAANPALPDQTFDPNAVEKEYYGTDEDVDRILTISNSSELMDFLVDSFDLMEHYEINPKLPKAEHRVRTKLGGLYDAKKNKHNAIEITVEDKDRNLAANMTNAARDKINTIATSLIKENQQKLLETYTNSIAESEKELAVVSDSLKQVKQRYGVYDTETQSEVFAEMIAKTRANIATFKAKKEIFEKAGRRYADSVRVLKYKISSSEEQLRAVQTDLEQFNLGIGRAKVLESKLKEGSHYLSKQRNRMIQLSSSYQSQIPAVILVEKGEVPRVKSRPRRSILVIGAVLIAFIFSALTALLLDTYRDVNWKDIYHGK